MKTYSIGSSKTRFLKIPIVEQNYKENKHANPIGFFSTFYVVSRTINLVLLIVLVYAARSVSGSPYTPVFNLICVLFDSVALCSRYAGIDEKKCK